ncbi:hypothetical protein NPIL_610951 [Nephila pilipes]|uniref:DNA polymerase epsilon catalytic subunit n=1 Tax=Nephila pilipes TaxID=299642 RepID=A0A8X6QU75_NEPPI|nr:hypothetical protein NPIL_610951 [Nephila pilipes]
MFLQPAKTLEVPGDSLQSSAYKMYFELFYGYVMRRGACIVAEMAGIVALQVRWYHHKKLEIVEQIEEELDTDGIQVYLPSSFPENFTIKTSNPKSPNFIYILSRCYANDCTRS